MPWVRPLFGTGELVWRDSPELQRQHHTSTPDEIEAVLPGAQLVADQGFDDDHAVSEDRRVRHNIDIMAGEILSTERARGMSVDRAREIARGAAHRVEHGSRRPTEAKRRK